ncbi:Protein BIG1 [Spathaspora sp. JA1]|nr:Protein BIG1 [Spathaspora sp. JA1]
MRIQQLVITSYVFTTLVTAQLAPLLVASHKLVPGLKQLIDPSNVESQNVTAATNLLKKLVTACSSDAYLIVNQPGLTYHDLTTSNKDNWPMLRKYLYMASTTVGIPRIDGVIDLQFLQEYIINTCEAEVINVWNEDEGEVVDYFDVRKRVIRIDLGELPTGKDRNSEILNHDELLRKILRKLPSPHYTIILTSDSPGVVHPVPVKMEDFPDRFEIFNDIINDPMHSREIEKNNNFHSVEPNWNPIRDSNDRYIRNKHQDEVRLLDYDLWTKNEKLITTIFVMILSIFMVKILQFFNYLKKLIMEYKQQKKTKGIIGKKMD